MGDNRMDSKDSRSTEIGLIDKREILGKAIFLMFPGTDGGTVELDLGRIGGLY
jgi:signal peptidase I